MGDTFAFTHISVSIDRSPQDVYAFISDGENLKLWASGLGNAFRRDGEQWRVEGPLGPVRVRLARPNDLGVADQTVTLSAGETVLNPVRVVANGTGSTVTFTLIRQPGVTEHQFTDDAKWIERDLATLKALLETR